MNPKLTRIQMRTLIEIQTEQLPLGAKHRTVKRLASWGYLNIARRVVGGSILYYRLTDKGCDALKG